ncbi:MAG: DUF444 family protein [Patescibacteria group bacterium]
MASQIDRDVERARKILKGRAREELRRYFKHGELIGRKGRDIVSIPIPNIEIPRFRFGDNSGGAGQGEGEIGDPIARGPDEEGDGDGEAGDQPGDHILEDFTLEELAEILGEELELPRLENKSRQTIVSQRMRYKSIRDVGPENLLARRRTLKQALLRCLSVVDPEDLEDPEFDLAKVIRLTRPDYRYRCPEVINEYAANAAIVYMLDVSGSMTDELKNIVRTMANWIDIWICSQYKGVECRYIIHNAAAREVDQNTFYHTRESGGTIISSAYKLFAAIINPSSGYSSPYGGTYSPEEWNIYGFHFSDGDNWGEDDRAALAVVSGHLLPRINLFGYTQIKSPYGSGNFLNSIAALKRNNGDGGFENLATAFLKGREDIFNGIKALLGKGK